MLKAVVALLAVCLARAAPSQQSNDPRRLAQQLESKLVSGQLWGLERAQTLEDYAVMLSRLSRYEEAVAARKEALKLRKKEGDLSGWAAIKAYAGLAQELKNVKQYDEAMSVLGEARAAALPVRAPLSRRATAVERAQAQEQNTTDVMMEASIQKIESALLDCAGDTLRALTVFETAKKLTEAVGLGWGADAAAFKAGNRIDTEGGTRIAIGDADIGHVLQYLRLLRRALSEPYVDALEEDEAEALAARVEAYTAALLQKGPWTNAQQLPRTFIPGLASRPWHSVKGQWPQLAPVQAALKAAYPALRSEFLTLQRASPRILMQETECIHSSTEGNWQYYTVNAPFIEPADADGCSAHTPAACALLRRVRQLGVPNFRLLRGGYSAIAPGGHLFPHCGVTNAQLKFHLGLIVPGNRFRGGSGDSSGDASAAVTAAGQTHREVEVVDEDEEEEDEPCAFLRVGDVSKPWREGGVLFFDDSWEHEVWNRCRAQRVVFQLVFSHPQLDLTSASNPFPPASL